MGQLFQILLISCLILVSANVIPNHLTNSGSNHNANSLSTVSPNSKPPASPNPYEECIDRCIKGPLQNQSVGMCKYNCENKHKKRVSQEAYENCMIKCRSGEAQSPSATHCRQSCDKEHPKKLLIFLGSEVGK